MKKDMENVILQRIKQIIKYTGLSDRKFSESVGIPQTTLSSLFQRNSDPSISLVQAILCSYPNISMPWLLFGNGNMLLTRRGEMLKAAREARNISIQQAAKALGVNINYYIRLESGEFHLNDDYKNILIEKFDIDPSELPEDIYPDQLVGGCENRPLILPPDEWLPTGKDYMLKEEGKENTLKSANDFETRPRIPYTAAAGKLSEALEGVIKDQCVMVPVVRSFPEYDFSIVVNGDSMSPEYKSGDEIACKRINDSRFIQWGRAHVLDTTQGIVIKCLYDDGDSIRCVSLNSLYPPFSIPKDGVYSISLVVGMLRL